MLKSLKIILTFFVLGQSVFVHSKSLGLKRKFIEKREQAKVVRLFHIALAPVPKITTDPEVLMLKYLIGRNFLHSSVLAVAVDKSDVMSGPVFVNNSVYIGSTKVDKKSIVSYLSWPGMNDFDNDFVNRVEKLDVGELLFEAVEIDPKAFGLSAKEAALKLRQFVKKKHKFHDVDCNYDWDPFVKDNEIKNRHIKNYRRIENILEGDLPSFADDFRRAKASLAFALFLDIGDDFWDEFVEKLRENKDFLKSKSISEENMDDYSKFDEVYNEYTDSYALLENNCAQSSALSILHLQQKPNSTLSAKFDEVYTANTLSSVLIAEGLTKNKIYSLRKIAEDHFKMEERAELSFEGIYSFIHYSSVALLSLCFFLLVFILRYKNRRKAKI